MSADESWFFDRARWFARWGRDPVEHFWLKTEPEPNSGCWLWTGGVDKDGYGKFQLFILPERKQAHVRAHRFAYAIEHGRPPKQMLLHSCDTPACCNPQHMREGTQAENIADKVAKGRQARGQKTGHYTQPERMARGSRHGLAKIDEPTALRIITLLKFGMRPAEVIRQLQVPRGIVYRISAGRTWQHVAEACR